MGPVVYFSDRTLWRKWIEENFDREKEVWLVLPTKSSGKPRLPYNDAVEEALCFGWIDSVQRPYNTESTIQRYSPRNRGSSYSQPNKERLRWLARRNLLHPSVRLQVTGILKEEFVFPRDIVNAIKRDKRAWEHYQRFSDTYKRIRIAYIDAARDRPEEFARRLANFIDKTREGKTIGYGGIEKYY